MKLFLLIIGCSFLAAAEPSLKDQWNSFKAAHGKKYSTTDEENFRFSIFKENMKTIEEHNAKYAKGEVTYDLQINKFGDMSQEEFSAKFNGFKKDISNPSMSSSPKFKHTINANLPVTVDWRKEGAVTPVKNQASCNGCWSFSTTGAMEGQLFLKKGRLVALSEQQLIDCSRLQGNEGCDGGLMEYAFQYIQQAGGLMSEDSYPFLGMDGYCMFLNSSVVKGTQIKSYVEVAAGDEEALKAAVATVGPVAVAVAASSRQFMFYHSGILTKEACGTKLTHAVLVVGYGSESNQDYWIVKNSWTTNWGENGYMKLARNKGNACGVATLASYPVLEATDNEGTTVSPAPTSQQTTTTTTTSKPPSSKAWKAVLSSWHLLFTCIFFSYFSMKI